MLELYKCKSFVFTVKSTNKVQISTEPVVKRVIRFNNEASWKGEPAMHILFRDVGDVSIRHNK